MLGARLKDLILSSEALGASQVALVVKNPSADAGDVERLRFQSLGQEGPLEEEMSTHFTILAWSNPMDRGAWWAIVHGVTKSWTRLRDFH